MWGQIFLGNCCSLRSFLFHKFCCFMSYLWCLQCRPKPFLGNLCSSKGLLFCRSLCLQCLIFHYLNSRSYLLLGNSYNLWSLLFCFIYNWSNILFCFSNFFLSIFNSLTTLLLHSSKEFNNLLLQLFQNWASIRIIFLLNNIILNLF